MLLGVLTINGAVINLYTEASKPSLLGAASGVMATSDCSTKASSFNLYIDRNLQNKYHHLFSFLLYASSLYPLLEIVIPSNV